MEAENTDVIVLFLEYAVPLAEFDCRQLNGPAAQRIESGSLQVIKKNAINKSRIASNCYTFKLKYCMTKQTKTEEAGK